MAIFAGNWKDEAGVPFCKNGYQRDDYGASGSAQSRSSHGWGSPRQVECRRNFCQAAGYWLGVLDEDDRTWWDNSIWMMWWPERSGDMNPWLGYRAFINFQTSAVSAGVPLELFRPNQGAPGLFRVTGAYYQGDEITVQTENDEKKVEEKSHLDIFQINPRSVLKRYEREHTRLLYSHDGWLDGSEFGEWGATRYWKEKTWPGAYRLFVRAWDVHLVVNYLIWAQPLGP